MTRGTALIIALVALALAVGAGWWLGRPAKVVETPAFEVIQDDGSKILTRAPDAKAKPKQQIPKGTTLERTIHIEAQGQGIKLPDGKMGVCPKVSIDLSLVRESNGMKRVVASSPDGQIVGAVDVPVETAAPVEDHPWAVGASYNPANQTGGIWVERDIGRIRVGVDLNQSRPNLAAPMGTEVRVRVGWAF